MLLTDVRLNTFFLQYVHYPAIAAFDLALLYQNLALAVFLVCKVSLPAHLTLTNLFATALIRLSRTPRLPRFHPYVRPLPLSPPPLTVLG
jgi:hypothetical protein